MIFFFATAIGAQLRAIADQQRYFFVIINPYLIHAFDFVFIIAQS